MDTQSWYCELDIASINVMQVFVFVQSLLGFKPPNFIIDHNPVMWRMAK